MLRAGAAHAGTEEGVRESGRTPAPAHPVVAHSGNRSGPFPRTAEESPSGQAMAPKVEGSYDFPDTRSSQPDNPEFNRISVPETQPTHPLAPTGRARHPPLTRSGASEQLKKQANMITLLRFMVMAVATLVEKAFLMDQRGAGDAQARQMAHRARFNHLSSRQQAAARDAGS